MALSRPFTLSSRSRSSTPALRAAAYMLSSKMSQPVNTRSLSPARGTNSLILGDRPSVRFPRRMVPICVSEPMGCAIPLRTASTPATNVVATAPMPGIITPSLPLQARSRAVSGAAVRFVWRISLRPSRLLLSLRFCGGLFHLRHILAASLSELWDVCKPTMFSYPVSFLQTRAS